MQSLNKHVKDYIKSNRPKLIREYCALIDYCYKRGVADASLIRSDSTLNDYIDNMQTTKRWEILFGGSMSFKSWSAELAGWATKARLYEAARFMTMCGNSKDVLGESRQVAIEYYRRGVRDYRYAKNTEIIEWFLRRDSQYMEWKGVVHKERMKLDHFKLKLCSDITEMIMMYRTNAELLGVEYNSQLLKFADWCSDCVTLDTLEIVKKSRRKLYDGYKIVQNG